MVTLFWIPATIAAAILQIARNALQRGLMRTSGPWGATLVRFLFGLPVSLSLVGMALWLVPTTQPNWGAAFWISACSGASAQILATAALLVAMDRAGFAVGTALQQSSLPLAAIFGLAVYQDQLSLIAWTGVAITTAGLVVLTWPSREQRKASLSGALLGLASGMFFGFALNAFRHASLALEPNHPIVAAILCLAVVQLMQSVALIAYLLWRDPATLLDVLRRWKTSLGAGLCGGAASLGWFVALALSPAAPVRALGIIEAPIAAFVGQRLFRETLSMRQILCGAAITAGVVLTALY